MAKYKAEFQTLVVKTS
jgi:hypothetical protein